MQARRSEGKEICPEWELQRRWSTCWILVPISVTSRLLSIGMPPVPTPRVQDQRVPYSKPSNRLLRSAAQRRSADLTQTSRLSREAQSCQTAPGRLVLPASLPYSLEGEQGNRRTSVMRGSPQENVCYNDFLQGGMCPLHIAVDLLTTTSNSQAPITKA